MHKRLNFLKTLKSASPTVLAIFGAAGVVVTAVLTAKATPKALQALEEAEKDGEGLTALEKVETCWKMYAPPAIAGVATIVCVLGSNTLNRRQQASTMAAYAFLAKSFNDYKKATKDIFGEEGHRQIMERIRVENPDPPAIYDMVWGNSFDFGETDENEHLFYDEFSQRYFRSTFSQVVLAELHTNRNFALGGGEVSIDDFYKFLGLDTPKELKDLYWWVCDSYCFIDFSHHLEHVDDGLNNDPVPCWVITMDCEPSLEPLE